MESTPHAQRTNRIRECMVNVVEKHFVPAMFASKEEGHYLVQKLEITIVVLMGEEMVPFDGVCEVGHEEPSRAITQATTQGYSENEF
eukprot:CAMPEP_0169136950 /NCGR_PEP_ID=MMETSP1015-20121227/41241_1 /TAXON_ID=342587 /ORGANISM="Karlodinium micrum, Strain CCMP2283" /LENGTH=86 /DNA_ID=CAMNT_0009201687 /DNA_START=225 /DNA_END=485 /DNA_ORIENTATION=+